jgi:Uma2 family endonuclease
MAQETKTLMTAEEFAKLPDNGMRRELVRGEVIEMTPTAAESGRISMRIALRLGTFVEEKRAGACYTAEAGFTIARDPDAVRAPDVAFVRRDRLPEEPLTEGFFPGAPDLAVEVVSPTDQAVDVQEKVNDYLKAGTSLVWVVYPRLRQVVVHRSLAESFTVEEGGTLTGDPVLPDLSIPVKEIFAQ